jgi:transposase-like protein
MRKSQVAVVRRVFSEDLKRKKVRELEQKLTSVCELSREYEVSRSAIYKWVDQYSIMRKQKVKMVVEAESDTQKIVALKKQVEELERMLGQKQVLLEFQGKMIDLAEEHYGVDIKKKFGSTPSSGSGNTSDPTPSA